MKNMTSNTFIVSLLVMIFLNTLLLFTILYVNYKILSKDNIDKKLKDTKKYNLLRNIVIIITTVFIVITIGLSIFYFKEKPQKNTYTYPSSIVELQHHNFMKKLNPRYPKYNKHK